MVNGGEKVLVSQLDEESFDLRHRLKGYDEAAELQEVLVECITTKEKGCKFVDARGPYSANNPQAIDAPRLYDQEGNYRGRLSTNTLDPDSISNPLGRYGSSISPESLNNPLGAGNPLDPGSPKNRTGRGWRIEGK
jgi:hypothetical protein